MKLYRSPRGKGLFFNTNKNTYCYTAFTKEGKRVTRSLKTTDPAEAKKRWLEETVPLPDVPLKKLVKENPDRFIYASYKVHVRGVTVGYTKTREEARKLRDKYIKSLKG